MIKVLPFSALKRHLQGEIFAPVDMGAHYELQSATRVMCGSNGNTYRFKTAENAALWLDTNTIKAVKNQITKQSAIDSLIIKQMSAPSDWLAEEIATLQARANGDWATFHAGEDLLAEWGIVAKGDKGDKGDAGLNGAAGGQLLKSALFSTGLVGNKALTFQHGLGGEPDFVYDYYEVLAANVGYPIGTKLKTMGVGNYITTEITAAELKLIFTANTAFQFADKTPANRNGSTQLASWKYCIQAFRWVV